MFQTIFLDLDDTLLDFGAAERVAIAKTFTDIGIERFRKDYEAVFGKQN